MDIKSEIDRGRDLHQQGKLDEARAIYETVLAYHPENDEVLSLMGLIALQSGQGETAVEFLNQAIQQNNGIAKYYSNLAIALLALGDIDGAHAQVSKAVEIDGNFVDALYNLGNIEAQRGERAAAAQTYRRVIELAADHVDAKSNLATMLRLAGDREEAVALTRQALALRPDDHRLMFNLATLLAETGETAECKRLLEQVVTVPELRTAAEAFKAKMEAN